MASDNILLSICIPTCSRSAVLRETLESITGQDVFVDTNDIEVVISDNASPDDTVQVANEFVRRFPGKVVFHRQETNTAGDNFRHVLALGRGQCLKLHNDNLIVRQGALRELLNMVRDVAHIRPVISMTNGNRVKGGDKPFVSCSTLDEFVQNVSYFSTWIGGFGVWREDLPLTSAFLGDASQLAQVDILCKLISGGRPALMCFGTYFISKQDHRGLYSWAGVFGRNYLGILKKYLASGKLSLPVYEQAKQEVLLRHILPTYFNTSNGYDKTKFFECLADYHDDEYFHQAISAHLPLLWRLNNPHNQTELRDAIHPSLLGRVGVGRRSRGAFNVMGNRNGSGRLEIGSMVSLGEGVSFSLDEAQPLGSGFLNSRPQDTAPTHGTIVVRDDVWIGSGALVLSGVTIGQGAVVAAGSVVANDVPPYSQVSGNPAQITGYRFEPYVIERLSTIDFSTLPDAAITELAALEKVVIDKNNVDIFMRNLGLASPNSPKDAQSELSVQDSAERIPGVLLLDAEGSAEKILNALRGLAASPQGRLPVVVLTTMSGNAPEWTDSVRYVQVSVDEYPRALEMVRSLADFEWVAIQDMARDI